MVHSAVTLCLVPEARQGPFVFHGGLEDGCARAAKLGFEAVELFPPAAEDLNARQVRQVLNDHGLALAAVGTGAGWIVRRLSLTSPDPGIRRRALDFINAIIDFAAAFGAPAIIGSMQGRSDDAMSRDQALDWLRAAIEQAGPRAHGAGTPLLLEPLNRYETNLLNRVEETFGFLDSLHTRNVKIVCDLFHMNIEEASLPEAIRTGKDLVGHIHFSDSNRCAVGFGHTNIPPVAQALREIAYGGYISAEVFPLPNEAAAAQRTLASFRQFFQVEIT